MEGEVPEPRSTSADPRPIHIASLIDAMGMPHHRGRRTQPPSPAETADHGCPRLSLCGADLDCHHDLASNLPTGFTLAVIVPSEFGAFFPFAEAARHAVEQITASP
jgi:hypothetical protein